MEVKVRRKSIANSTLKEFRWIFSSKLYVVVRGNEVINPEVKVVGISTIQNGRREQHMLMCDNWLAGHSQALRAFDTVFAGYQRNNSKCTEDFDLSSFASFAGPLT